MSADDSESAAKKRKVEEEADAKMKEEPTELEGDAKKESRKLIADAVSIDPANATLNVIPALDGRVLMPLTDGGLQYLIAGARANVGITKGRYLFEVKVLELLSPAESSRGNRAPAPRQAVKVGFSTQGSSLFLGDGGESVCFDSEGSFTADGAKQDGVSKPFGRDDVIGIVLNLDDKSPNANTLSVFKGGQRISQPQKIPDALKGKPLYPHINFKNVTLQVNFGASPMVPLPFTCHMISQAAVADSKVQKAPTKEGGYEVLLPVGIPDEGTFDWLDMFLEKNPKYVELSDRKILEWADKSGIWRDKRGSYKHSNDKPDINFGIPGLDDMSVQRVIKSIVASQPRDYVVMEVKANLVKEERADCLKRFNAPHYKKVAMVVMGDPPAAFKAKTQAALLKQKEAQEELAWKQRVAERTAKKELKAKIKAAEEARKKAEEEAKKQAEEVKRKSEEEAKAKEEGDPENKDEEGVKEESKDVDMKQEEAKEEVKQEDRVKEEVKEESKEEEDEEEEEEEKEPKQAELTAEEKAASFLKKPVPDIATFIMSSSFTKFSMPTKEEGFDEIRYDWQAEKESANAFGTWARRQKLLCRIEDLQPSESFRTKLDEWQKVLQGWHAKANEWKAGEPARQAEAAAKKKKEELQAQADETKAAEGDAAKAEKPEGAEEGSKDAAKEGEAKEGDSKEGEAKDAEAKESEANDDEAKECAAKDGEAKEEAKEEPKEIEDVFAVENIADVGGGKPLFALFGFEDWALLSLRVELHLLLQGFKSDATSVDPERIGIHEQHLPFYYNKYLRKTFNVRYYGKETTKDLVELVKDTVAINSTNSVLEVQLSSESENFDMFVKLTEDARRERQRRLDAGDETARLKFSQPEPQRHYGGGQRYWDSGKKGDSKGYQKGGYQKGAYQPYNAGGKGGSYGSTAAGKGHTPQQGFASRPQGQGGYQSQQVCRNFQKGNCTYGERCRFLHQ